MTTWDPKTASVLTTLRDYLVGPTRFMNVLSCFELGIVDLLRDNPRMTAREIAESVGGTEAAIQQLLFLPVKDELISFDKETGTYALDGLSLPADVDMARVLKWYTMIKVVCLRQLFYLTESVKTGSLVGLRELYGFEGTLYEATARHEDLRTAWGGSMDSVTGAIDEWFFGNFEVPAGAKVLDVAGNTGLGAILTRKYKPEQNVTVACFDFPEKEAAALENFRAHGETEHCSFIGGDVFKGLPTGFDVVMIKHFLGMFDRENVLRIFNAVHDALQPGGELFVLAPVYPEDLTSSVSVDFFPAYFIGCTMGEGGPQQMSTYSQWLAEAGFEVVSTLQQDISTMPPDMIHVHGMIRAVRK
nr:methyltransferase [Kibdelosporangium sp. MJ126-NF4]CEL16442.1 O-methyltransferase [Kibdelosporangium sp. MJ126-NF4]CTQ90394.1 O-methyltransferase [Kibdelosporangium sp. MJ126-NF4]